MDADRPARVPGRPKDQDKGAAIIAAAQALFTQRGYDGVTMEAVAAAARGELAIGASTEAAEDLLSLWLGDMMMRMSLGLAGPLTDAEIERRARRGTAVFLRAYGVPKEARSAA